MKFISVSFSERFDSRGAWGQVQCRLHEKLFEKHFWEKQVLGKLRKSLSCGSCKSFLLIEKFSWGYTTCQLTLICFLRKAPEKKFLIEKWFLLKRKSLLALKSLRYLGMKIQNDVVFSVNLVFLLFSFTNGKKSFNFLRHVHRVATLYDRNSFVRQNCISAYFHI